MQTTKIITAITIASIIAATMLTGCTSESDKLADEVNTEAVATESTEVNETEEEEIADVTEQLEEITEVTEQLEEIAETEEDTVYSKLDEIDGAKFVVIGDERYNGDNDLNVVFEAVEKPFMKVEKIDSKNSKQDIIYIGDVNSLGEASGERILLDDGSTAIAVSRNISVQIGETGKLTLVEKEKLKNKVETNKKVIKDSADIPWIMETSQVESIGYLDNIVCEDWGGTEIAVSFDTNDPIFSEYMSIAGVLNRVDKDSIELFMEAIDEKNNTVCYTKPDYEEENGIITVRVDKPSNLIFAIPEAEIGWKQ